MTARPGIQVKRLKIIDMDSYSGKLGGKKQQGGDLRDMVKERGSEVGSVEGSIICSSKAKGGQYEMGIYVLSNKFYAFFSCKVDNSSSCKYQARVKAPLE